MVFPADEYGCSPYGAKLTEKIVVVKRGNCTFYQKAEFAFAANISVLAVVNNEDRLESPASGLGIVKEIKESDLKTMAALSVVSAYVHLFNISFSHHSFNAYSSPDRPDQHVLHSPPHIECQARLPGCGVAAARGRRSSAVR